ncbi:hypothetical protein D3C72_199620 [compost metagenome]
MSNFSSSFKRITGVLTALAMASLMAACATITSSTPPQLAQGEVVALLPIVNLTETPQAGARAEAIVESLLQSGSGVSVKRFQGPVNRESLFQTVDREAVEQATAAARAAQVKYGLTGSVQEWRYKVGVDGEPAVGITLKLINLETGEVVWTATGSRTGWSRNAVSAIAQDLLGNLLTPLLR